MDQARVVPSAGWLSALLLVIACGPSASSSGSVVPSSIAVAPVASPPGLPVEVAPKPPSELTDAELIERYTPLWKATLAQRNGASCADVDRELRVKKMRIMHPAQKPSDPGSFLVVEYSFAIDWAKVDVIDVMPFRVDPRAFPLLAGLAPDFKPAADGWLTTADADMLAKAPLLTMALLGATIARVPFNRGHLAHDSLDTAMAAVQGTTSAKFNATYAKIELSNINDVKEPTGLYLRAIGAIPGTTNCMYVNLELTSGAVDRSESYCGPMN